MIYFILKIFKKSIKVSVYKWFRYDRIIVDTVKYVWEVHRIEVCPDNIWLIAYNLCGSFTILCLYDFCKSSPIYLAHALTSISSRTSRPFWIYLLTRSLNSSHNKNFLDYCINKFMKNRFNLFTQVDLIGVKLVIECILCLLLHLWYHFKTVVTSVHYVTSLLQNFLISLKLCICH